MLTLALRGQLQFLQLAGVILVDHLLDRPEGKQQIPVAPTAAFGDHLGGLGCDEIPLLQLSDVLAHGILAHAYRLTDSFDAGPALVGPVVFTSPQETVH